jgi:ribosomal peptide maturation radical SAM protein 1
VVDNILDMRYFKDFIPALASRRLKVGFFYETKSNLNRQQVRLLRDSGIREIQPGIENFSDSVLKLMRKGVTGLQNIQLLKWCKEFGIEPSWNFLWGFPGESSQEYTRMASVVPLLMHLPPPVSCDDIRLDRFSPNYFDAERLGFTDVRPLPAYRHVYPLSAEAVSNLACYFAYRYREPQDVARYVGPLARQLEKWKRLKNRTDLFSVDCGRFLVIVDLRPTSRRPFVVLAGIERQLYCECDATRDLCQITGIAATDGSPAAPELIERTIAPLVEAGLLLRDGTRYLALAIPLGEYTPSPSVAREFWNVVRKRGIRQGHRWLVPAVRIGFVNREREMARRRVRNRDTRPGAARGNGTRRPGVCGRSVAPIAACQFSVDARGRLVIRASERSRTERSC